MDRSNRVLLCLAEMAVHQVAIGARDEARRTIGDAVIVLEQTKDDASIGRASVLLGEALVALDAPQHAKKRFAQAVDICERIADRRWALRARLGLGRTLVLLDDLSAGCEILARARESCGGDPTLLAQIDGWLREAEKLFDTPRTVKTGYGRPVTVVPPPPRDPGDLR
jgi:hypothetical protein